MEEGMKNVTARLVLAAMVSFAMLAASGCGGGASNSNVNRNANTNINSNSNLASANANATADLTPEMRTVVDDSCAKYSMADRKKYVNDTLLGKINGKDDDQEDQIGVQYNVGHFFSFALKEETGPQGDYLDLYVAGQVSTSGKNQDQFKHLQNFVRPLMTKGCIEGVILLPRGTPIPLTTSSLTRSSGFDWFVCEAPTNPCPNGTCSESCRKLTKSGDSVEPGEQRRLTNSASNTNSNSGANKAP
jgi:hypothetical protein